MDIPARHGRLHCIIQGKGDPLVLLHGGLGTGEAHFRMQISEFASLYRVIAPTFLGYGKSQRRATFDEHYHERDAEDIVALVQRLELPPVHICGFSDGAIVAMIVAADNPSLVRSLILVGGQAVFDQYGMQEGRKLIPVEQIPPGFQMALARSHGEPYWRQLVTRYVEVGERIYENGGEVTRDRLAAIECPTLIVHGENDPWIGPEHPKMLHGSIRHSELDLFPYTGHEIHREKPNAFNRRVLKFLAAVTR
jgi:pimeloyl-ACP methyl ester carboxylesterase